MQRVERIVTTYVQPVDGASLKLTVAAERALVESARRGDTRAFEDLINATSRLVFSLIGRMIDDASTVEDLSQNAYMKAWMNLREFKGKSRFATWIYRIAMNETLSYIRKESRKRLNETGDSESLANVASKRVEESVVIDKITVNDAMCRLPLQFRTAISLSYLDGLSYEEAAHIMSVPLNTYRTLVHRGKVRLRKILEGDKR